MLMAPFFPHPHATAGNPMALEGVVFISQISGIEKPKGDQSSDPTTPEIVHLGTNLLEGSRANKKGRGQGDSFYSQSQKKVDNFRTGSLTHSFPGALVGLAS